MNGMDTLVELQHVGCRTGKTFLLKDINWQISAEERWIVFGENGSGKTTLLSLIAGYKPYNNGCLRLFGQKQGEEFVLENRQRICLVSTSFFANVYCKESVFSIVLSGKWGSLGVMGYPCNQDIKKAKQLLAYLQIEQKMDIPYCFLSKGEQQLTLLARAMMSEAEIFLFDEADSGLDLLARIRLQNVLEKIGQERSATMVYVTHYPNELPTSFDKCLLLKKGEVFYCGAIEEAFNETRFSKFLDQAVCVQKHRHGYDVMIR